MTHLIGNSRMGLFLCGLVVVLAAGNARASTLPPASDDVTQLGSKESSTEGGSPRSELARDRPDEHDPADTADDGVAEPAAEGAAEPGGTPPVGPAAPPIADDNAVDDTGGDDAVVSHASDDADAWVRRGTAGAAVFATTFAAGVLAAFIIPLGLGHWIFPVIAVALPAVVAGATSIFVVPWWWSWAPALAAFGGTLVGGVVGALVGLAAASQFSDDAFGGISPNVVVLLPTMGLITGLTAATAAAGTAMLVGGPRGE